MRVAAFVSLNCSGPTACEPADGSKGLGSTYCFGILRPRSYSKKNKVDRDIFALRNRNQNSGKGSHEFQQAVQASYLNLWKESPLRVPRTFAFLWQNLLYSQISRHRPANLLPQSPKCWGDRCVPPCLALVVTLECYVRRKGLQTYCHIDGRGQTPSVDPRMNLLKLSPLALCESGLGPLQQFQLLLVLFQD